MKFTHEVTINLPVARVVELADNPDNLKYWQPELVSFEHFTGATRCEVQAHIRHERTEVRDDRDDQSDFAPCAGLRRTSGLEKVYLLAESMV
ncbi:MAG: SRPBCC family protein [Candidatus Peregrinibacteria bacterium]|nr:SRPBCC family protein [Candidatus Peregrinibacteria bacterium]